MSNQHHFRPAAVLAGAALILSMQAFAAPANAAPHESPSPVSTTRFFSQAEQLKAEATVAQFVLSHPMPQLVPGSSTEAYDAFQDALETYWSSVPWESVFAQWDCHLTSDPTVSRGVSEGGMPFVVLEESHECGEPQVGDGRPGLVEPRGATPAPHSSDDATTTSTTASSMSPTAKCSSSSGEASACVEPVRQGTVRASGTNLRNSTSLARVRAGQSSLTSCSAGTEVAVGGYGTWTSGQTKSLTFSVNQNANWSSTYQRETSLNNFTNVVTACELI